MPSTPLPVLTCDVSFLVYQGANPVQGARVLVSLDDQNSTLAQIVVSRQDVVGVTDEDGACILSLIRLDQFTKGGVYKVQVSDPDGKLIHHRRVTVPNLSSCKATELIDV